MAIQYQQRSASITQELYELTFRSSSLTFGYVRWNRGARSPDLICQSKSLVSREPLGNPVNSNAKIDRLSPGDKVTMALDRLVFQNLPHAKFVLSLSQAFL